MLNFRTKATKKKRDSWSLMIILVKEEILEIIWDATVDRAIANSSEEATTFNSNNEENKHKSIEAARWGVGKDEVLGLSNVVVTKQDNSIARSCRTLVSHKKK